MQICTICNDSVIVHLHYQSLHLRKRIVFGAHVLSIFRISQFFFSFLKYYILAFHISIFLPCTCSVSNMSTLELFFSFTYFIVYRHTPEKTEMPNCTMQGKCELEEQGWRSGESARLPPLWLGFDSCPVPFVGLVCCWFSSLFRGFFSVFTGFPPSTKIKTTNLARPG